jgi:Integrase core domain.
MMRGACGLHDTPEVVHSDGGPSMMSKTARTLLADLGVIRSRSRPHVSNDNPCHCGCCRSRPARASHDRDARSSPFKRGLQHSLRESVQQPIRADEVEPAAAPASFI